MKLSVVRRCFVIEKIDKNDREWRKILTPDQYHVLREKGTERAFSGNLHENHAAGLYRCAGCGLELFNSEHKYDSGTGWPSFYAPLNKKSIRFAVDRSFLMQRIEVLCARCGGHLGHVFGDGPPPTGQRYCINSAALTFEEAS